MRSFLHGTQWRQVLRTAVSGLHRELRVSLTPVVTPQKWLFIVGCYNSGTELLMSMLGRHPGIASLPVEGQFLTDQFVPDYELGLPRMWALREDLFRLTESDAGPDVTRLKKEWIMRLDRSRPVFLEKSPPNSARTRWLQAHFENAHFVAIVRDGYAVAEGIRRKAEPHHLKSGWPIELCARQWRRTYEVLLEDARYLQRLHWVKYEDLTAQPRDELGKILAFLNLPVDAPGFSLDGTWAVHEKTEPIRNMNAENIAALSQDDIAVISQEAQPVLRHFGYAVR